jgi:hypothetical protein
MLLRKLPALRSLFFVERIFSWLKETRLEETRHEEKTDL